MKFLIISTGWKAIRKIYLDRNNGIRHQYNEIGNPIYLNSHYSLSIRVTR